MSPSQVKKTLILLCLSLWLAACGRGQSVALSSLDEDAVILAFGDSLTHGSGAESQQAYPNVLADLIAREVVIEATPGDKSADGLAKFSAALDKHQPDLVLLCLGGNDFLRKVPETSTKANLAQMIEMAQAQQAQVVLLGVPKPALLGLKAHPMYRELAARYQLPLENEAIAEALSSARTKSDAIHPNASGYRMIAEAVAKLLQAAGAVPSV